MISDSPLVTNIYLSNNQHDRDNIFVKLFGGRDSSIDTRPALDYKLFLNKTPAYTGKITNARMEWSGR